MTAIPAGTRHLGFEKPISMNVKNIAEKVNEYGIKNSKNQKISPLSKYFITLEKEIKVRK